MFLSGKRILSLILCITMLSGSLLGLVACGAPDDGKNADTSANSLVEEAGTEEYDPFKDVNYNDRPFRIYTSTNIACTGMGNSNFLIEGTNTTDGGLVNDAVLERNVTVEEKLGVKLEFTQVNITYNDVQADVRKYVSSGDHEFDLVINDLFPFANLAIEGNFRNTLEPECVFDFEKEYWYADYMEDLRLIDGYQYLLAGDYFIDLIRSAHCLLYNKDIYQEYYQTDPNEVYNWVLNYEWTYEKMSQMITDVYEDTNHNSVKDKGDMFGFMVCEFWGPSIPFSISGNPTFITRDETDGIPTVTLMADEGKGRADALANAMKLIFLNDAASIDKTPETELLDAFTQGQALIVGYQRLGSLENPSLRGMEGDIGIVPYPMLYADDKRYVTSTHDTSELGAILATATDLGFTSTVIEVLNRETAKLLMPKYYKEALQIQYVDDSTAASMIDIIHDNFGNSFALAYNNALGSTMLQSFTAAMQENREFSTVFKGYSRSINRQLENKIKQFKKNNNID
ncbi:MAG: hypothetical protein E7661_06905 [Ruminococcaceae bacterium]|nr:hypothetical protein [Oscillospiraceae bacterium]